MSILPSAAAALLLLAGARPLPAAPPKDRKLFQAALFTWVRRVPAEKGAPANGFPVRVDPASLARALAGVNVVARGKAEPLFTQEELGKLCGALADAFAAAQPGEDLELLSTSKRVSNLLEISTGVTARAFVLDGKLDLIVHDARMDFLEAYNVVGQQPNFDYGTRARPSGVVLQVSGGEVRRPDWVVLPLPAAPAAGAPAPLPPPPSAAAPPSLADRLRGLKEARDQNLLTEEEYKQKREDLLKAY